MNIELPNGKEIQVRAGGIIGFVIVFALILGLFTSVYQIQPDERGVVLRFGKHIETVGPGLKWKLPYGIDQVYKVPTEVVGVEIFGYRVGPRGETDYIDTQASMLTGDLNIVLAGWDVQFVRENPEDFLFKVRDPIDTLRDISQSVMREVLGDRASIPILTVGRAEIQERVRELIQQTCDQFGMGLRINEVNLLFVDPPRQVVSAFNDLNKAEQDAVRFFEEASREYQERVPRAAGEAQRMILEAEGAAERRINVARGEAQRFIDTLEAYEKSPSVTRVRLYLETLEAKVPELKDVIVVDDDVRSVLPLLNLGGDHQQ